MVYRVNHNLSLGAIPMPENLATSLHITVLHALALPTSKKSRHTSAEQNPQRHSLEAVSNQVRMRFFQ